MKVPRICQVLLATATAVLASHTVYAQASDALYVEPFTGEAGFQEIRLGSESWYVAFHGTRKHAISSVQAGWLARAAQLCESAGKPYIVELRYVGQSVYPEDPIAAYENLSILRVAGPVYIPMFIPSGPRNIPPNLTPTKAAAIRCVERPSGLKAGLAAVPISEAKEGARKAGLLTR